MTCIMGALVHNSICISLVGRADLARAHRGALGGAREAATCQNLPPEPRAGAGPRASRQVAGKWQMATRAG